MGPGLGQGWDRGGMKGPTLAGTGSGASPLSIEVRAMESAGRRRGAVDATNFVGAARARSICVIAAR